MAEPKRSYVVKNSRHDEELLEDLEDLALIAQRRNEPTIPLDVVVQQLEAVMLPIEEYEELLEEDLALIAQRRNEPTIPLDVVVQQLEMKWRRTESR